MDMIVRNFIARNAKFFSEHDAKNFVGKFLTVTELLSKKWNDFTQLWRQWSCLL